MMLGYLVLWSFLVFSADQPIQEVQNGFAKTENHPKTIKIAVIDSDKAGALFKEFVRHKEIPYQFLPGGCHARATAMAKIAEEQQVPMGKVFAEGFLRIETGNRRFPVVIWGWHVAPVAFVTNEYGTRELMVFDPSLFDKPVTLEKWRSKLLGPPEQKRGEFYYGARYQYEPKSSEENKTEWQLSDLERMRRELEQNLKLQNKIEYYETEVNSLQQSKTQGSQ